jgi:transposase-like protein
MNSISMRGKKGVKHVAPTDPPRRRALKLKGHGTYANDLVPVVATLGRRTKSLRLQVIRRTDAATLEAHVRRYTRPGATVNTDDWKGYNHLPRRHRTVNHRVKEWARDDDGDGIREVHVNGLEGRWLSVRNFLRPFRGVHKAYLSHYLALCVWTMTHRHLQPRQLAAFVKLHDSYT